MNKDICEKRPVNEQRDLHISHDFHSAVYPKQEVCVSKWCVCQNGPIHTKRDLFKSVWKKEVYIYTVYAWKRHIPLFWWFSFLVNMSLFCWTCLFFCMYTSCFRYTKKSIMGTDLLCCRSRKRPGQFLTRSLSRWLIFCLHTHTHAHTHRNHGAPSLPETLSLDDLFSL